jgi:hypothetical protein
MIMGTRISTGADRVSGSKSGMNAKSMVEESLTALRLRLVLKWRTGLDSAVLGAGVAATAGPLEAPVGLSEVRIEEKVAGPVM